MLEKKLFTIQNNQMVLNGLQSIVGIFKLQDISLLELLQKNESAKLRKEQSKFCRYQDMQINSMVICQKGSSLWHLRFGQILGRKEGCQLVALVHILTMIWVIFSILNQKWE